MSVRANNQAGNQIDDKVASLFAVTMLRNRYRLAGHRRVVPDVRLKGRFADMGPPCDATMIVEPDGGVRFEIRGRQSQAGQILQVSGDEDWVKTILGHRLRQTTHHGGYLVTPLGDIKDQEDIEIALALADRESGQQFQADLVVDLKAHQRALHHFVVKVALCIGHRILGPEWAFGPDGICLRKALFPGRNSLMSRVRGTLFADIDGPLRDMLDLAPSRHSLALFRFGDTAVAFVALFGGDLGVAAVGLSRSAKKYRKGRQRVVPEGHLFQLELSGMGKPSFSSKSLDEMLLNVSPFF